MRFKLLNTDRLAMLSVAAIAAFACFQFARLAGGVHAIDEALRLSYCGLAGEHSTAWFGHCAYCWASAATGFAAVLLLGLALRAPRSLPAAI